jgi:hypothetical protein
LLPITYLGLLAGIECADCEERQITGPDGSCEDCGMAQFGDRSTNTCQLCPTDGELLLDPYGDCGWSGRSNYSATGGACCDSVATRVFSCGIAQVVGQGYDGVRFDVEVDGTSILLHETVCEDSWADAIVEVDMGEGAGWQPYLTSGSPVQGVWVTGSSVGDYCVLTTASGSGYSVNLGGVAAARVTAVAEYPYGTLPARVVVRAGPSCS